MKQKILSILLTLVLVFGQVAPVLAVDAPGAPSAPDAPSEPSAPASPSTPGSTPEENTPEQTQQQDSSTNNGTSENQKQQDENPDDEVVSNTDPNAGHFDPTLSAEEVAAKNAEREARKAAYIAAMNAQNASGQNGDTEIKTGDATSTANVTTGANNNLSGVGSGTGSIGLNNTGNGSGSNNNSSASVNNNNQTNQNNSASVNTNLEQSSITGNNDSSKNVGNTSITTGDANVSGTVVTAVNTNVAGVSVSEFNVADDHMGDIILDFGANCISGCLGSSAQVQNSGNGSDSDNNANVDITNETETTQNNDAVIGNDLVLVADTGNNTADKNTGGDTSITTGDANIAANVLTFANNNIAGNVVFGVINIFGDLIGDIIFPEDQLQSAGNIAAVNSGNGSNSDNDADITLNNSDATFQSNDANITNNLIFDAQTGNNDASKNTGGDSSITTGDTTVDANILNIANSNIDGGTWWLVFINDAGNWLGKIVGAPAGATFAGSQGTDFQVDENGFITAVNNGNGSGSDNNASVNQTNNNTTTQTNTATIENNLNLTANTGGNSTSQNTGGNSQIKTGDVNIVANMVNFVNNNIVGNGKLVVTTVNVFGSWIGDFVLPGQKKESKPQEQNTENLSDSRGGNSNHTQSTNTPSQETSTPANVAMGNVDSSDTDGEVLLTTQGDGTVEYTTAVAGVQTTATTKTIKQLVGSSTTDAEKMTVNLAWALLAFPTLGLVLLGKRFSKFVTLPKVQ